MMRTANLLPFLVLLLLLAACGTSSTPTPSPQVSATPTIPPLATVTHLSPSAREVLVDFANKHQKITTDWEQFHLDFDRWVADSLACNANSLREALAQFVGDFAGITEAARELPRSSNVTDLADTLIKAAEDDEKALRDLVRTWRPDNQDVFEIVDLQQSNSVAAQKAVDDALVALKEGASAASRTLLGSFSATLDELNGEWDTFHRDYDTFRSEQRELTASDRIARLGALVSQFGELAIQVRNLPTSSITRPVTDMLVAAAEQEELALRKLMDAFEREQGASGEPPMTPGEPGTDEAAALPKSVFEDFDTQLVQRNASRREATEGLADIVKSSSIENEQAVAEFATSYDELRSAWKRFHQAYDVWRSIEGGCDRSAVTATLAQFSISFSELAKEVRALPRLPILQPLGEVLVTAAEREDQAFKSLRDTWRPFDPDVYNPFERERNAASKLRRQVDAGVNQLLTQYDISLQELAR